jgi:hypothetical protein
MSILFDKNADGTLEYFSHDDATDSSTITTVQDVSGLLDALKQKRNLQGDKIGCEFWHYATIPTVVEIALRNKGIDINNPTHTKAIIKEINQNYPYLKATNLKHA